MGTRSIGLRFYSQFAALAVSAVANIVLLPFVVGRVGAEQYGVWLIVLAIYGYTALLDLGLTQVTTRRIAELNAAGRSAELGEFIGMQVTTYALLGLIGTAGLAVLGVALTGVLGLPAQFLPTYFVMLAVLSVHTAYTFYRATWPGVLAGLERYEYIYAIAICSTILRLGGTVLAVDAGLGIVSVAIMLLLSTMFTNEFTRVVVNRLLGQTSLGAVRKITWAEFKSTFVAGRPMFVGNLSGRLHNEGGRLYVGIVSPAAQVTLFEVGAVINGYSRHVLYAASLLMPRFAALSTTSSGQEFRELYLRGARVFAIIYGLLFVYLTVFSQEIINLWMGPAFLNAGPILITLMIGSLMQSINTVGHYVLMGMSNLRVFERVMIAYALMGPLFSLVLGAWIGPLGVAAGSTAVFVCLEPILVREALRTVGVSFREYWSRSLLPAGAIVGLFAISLAFAKSLTASSGQITIFLAFSAVYGVAAAAAVALSIRAK